MGDTLKDIVAKSIFIIIDFLIIALCVYFAFILRSSFSNTLSYQGLPVGTYLSFYPIYLIVGLLFAYEGIYTYRYDFWHETRKVLKALVFASVLTFAYLAMTKNIEYYSRLLIGFSFIFMAFLIPFSKLFIKNFLYKIGIWSKRAKIYADDPFLVKEIYGNPYLGYIEPDNCEFSTIFINSKKDEAAKLKEIIAKEIKVRKNVIFTPILDEYDLTHSHIYELSNTRTNLIVYQNRLMSWHRRLLQSILNYAFVLLLLPILLPLIGLIVIAIKLESAGSAFFVHKRIGKNGKVIPVLKFRSMYKDSKERLEELLKSDAKIKEEWEKNFKIKDDPRVTKVGKFLRKTSLDELPQILNVLAGHMNFVGPRPVIKEEIEQYYKESAEYYYMVKPGITGLWQVSGRSDTDYDFRIKTDKWYVVNWSIWLDIVILLKTVKVVLKREGAY
jgi:undecaprenyl-phosphate galactose phosphotransferase